jgi:hypothetical protein
MRPIQYVFAGVIAVAVLTTFSAHRAAARQGQPQNSTGPQVHMTVSAEARHGLDVPEVNREDVLVGEGKEHDRVVSWLPAQGANAGMEFLVLIDDSSSVSLGSQMDDIRAFINAQPPTTFVGVGYMQNGTVQFTQNFTQDHASAAKALRLPLGAEAGVGASPYFSISDIAKRWQANPARPRREILMISDGIDGYYGGGPTDPYLDDAVADAQRAGITVYSIYTTGSGHARHSFFLNNWGQNYLSELAEMTGAESYWQGFGPAVDFTPYLDELSHQLQHQYLLTFIPKPEKKAGFQRVRLSTESSGAELIYQKSVFVPATPD